VVVGLVVVVMIVEEEERAKGLFGRPLFVKFLISKHVL